MPPETLVSKTAFESSEVLRPFFMTLHDRAQVGEAISSFDFVVVFLRSRFRSGSRSGFAILLGIAVSFFVAILSAVCTGHFAAGLGSWSSFVVFDFLRQSASLCPFILQ